MPLVLISTNQPKVFIADLTTNMVDFNLADHFESVTGVPTLLAAPTLSIVTVSPGVSITSSGLGQPFTGILRVAFTTGEWTAGSELEFTNEGDIYGAGGDGGQGGGSFCSTSSAFINPGVLGRVGGTALEFEIPASLINNGVIGSGGGGGGGGGSSFTSFNDLDLEAGAGGGGGGGQSSVVSAGGTAGSNAGSCTDERTAEDGDTGDINLSGGGGRTDLLGPLGVTAGNVGLTGASAPVGSTDYDDVSRAGTGGSGGGYGAAGGPGGTGFGNDVFGQPALFVDGGVGGAAGIAVMFNSDKVSYINNGTVYGPVP